MWVYVLLSILAMVVIARILQMTDKSRLKRELEDARARDKRTKREVY